MSFDPQTNNPIPRIAQIHPSGEVLGFFFIDYWWFIINVPTLPMLYISIVSKQHPENFILQLDTPKK